MSDTNNNNQTNSEIVLTPEEYKQLSEATNAEQGAKLRCWDIQEYIDGVNQQKAQLETALVEAGVQLEDAKQLLAGARTQTRAVFESLFTPLGLANKTVSVSLTPPHVVTVHDTEQQTPAATVESDVDAEAVA
ncbi:MAG: hypothetical protein JSS66_05405 [Armatimonadetes bacterium]|nr:hypothetical protein [Armatimonadota bacterium]